MISGQFNRRPFTVKRHARRFTNHRIRSAAAAALAIAVLLSGCAPLQKAGKQLSSAAEKQIEAVSSAVSSGAASLADSLPSSSKPSPSSAAPAVSAKASSKASSSAVTRKTTVKAPAKKTDVRSVQKINTSLPSKTAAKKQITAPEVPQKTYTSVQQAGAYQNLSSAEKQLYSLIKNSVYQIALQPVSGGYYPIGQIWISQKLSEAQIRISMTAFMDDNPQVFWLANAYTYGYDGGTTIVQLFSVLSPAQAQAAVSRLDGKINSILQAMPSGLNEFDREEYLFDYIAAHCTYDDAAVIDDSRWQAFTSYGVLVDGLAVCEGYAKAMQLLAGDAGLTCTVVHGTSGGVGHMWNAVVIGGKWYNLDVTWCDNTILIYNYYNVPDSVLKLTHTIGATASSLSDAQICSGSTQFNVFLPSCTSSDANYFRVKGAAVSSKTDAADESVIQSLAAMMKAGRTSFPFFIDGTPYDSQVSAVVSAKMYHWLTAAASQAGRALNTDTMTYVTDKADSGVTMHVSYQ